MVEDEDQFEAFEEKELKMYSVTLQQYSVPEDEEFRKNPYSVPKLLNIFVFNSQLSYSGCEQFAKKAYWVPTRHIQFPLRTTLVFNSKLHILLHAWLGWLPA